MSSPSSLRQTSPHLGDGLHQIRFTLSQDSASSTPDRSSRQPTINDRDMSNSLDHLEDLKSGKPRKKSFAYIADDSSESSDCSDSASAGAPLRGALTKGCGPTEGSSQRRSFNGLEQAQDASFQVRSLSNADDLTSGAVDTAAHKEWDVEKWLQAGAVDQLQSAGTQAKIESWSDIDLTDHNSHKDSHSPAWFESPPYLAVEDRPPSVPTPKPTSPQPLAYQRPLRVAPSESELESYDSSYRRYKKFSKSVPRKNLPPPSRRTAYAKPAYVEEADDEDLRRPIASTTSTKARLRDNLDFSRAYLSRSGGSTYNVPLSVSTQHSDKVHSPVANDDESIRVGVNGSSADPAEIPYQTNSEFSSPYTEETGSSTDSRSSSPEKKKGIHVTIDIPGVARSPGSYYASDEESTNSSENRQTSRGIHARSRPRIPSPSPPRYENPFLPRPRYDYFTYPHSYYQGQGQPGPDTYSFERPDKGYFPQGITGVPPWSPNPPFAYPHYEPHPATHPYYDPVSLPFQAPHPRYPFDNAKTPYFAQPSGTLPVAEKVAQADHSAPHIASSHMPTLYKPPISARQSGPEISFQLSLQPRTFDSHRNAEDLHLRMHTGVRFEQDPTLSQAWSHRNYKLQRDGFSQLSTALAVEHYSDGLGHDKVSMVYPNNDDWLPIAGHAMRWLHLEQQSLCLNDLVGLVSTCQFLDDDYVSLALHLLQVECPKLEKSFSNGQRSGFYLEPGTVLRCDGQCDQDLNRGAKSAFFCATPLLRLEAHSHGDVSLEAKDERIHRTRTLLESLYNFDLMDERDLKQVVRRSPEDSAATVICVPQVWYLLCGSLLITCGPLSLAELRGTSIQETIRPEKILIATVTDLDRHCFTVALRASDSYFAARQMVDSLRSNVGGNPISDYDIELDDGEPFTAQTWLDIIMCDPLPLLKLTLKSNAQRENKSMALVLRESTHRNPVWSTSRDFFGTKSHKSGKSGDSGSEYSEQEHHAHQKDRSNRSLIVKPQGEVEVLRKDMLIPYREKKSNTHSSHHQRTTDDTLDTPSAPTYSLDSYKGSLVLYDGHTRRLRGDRAGHYETNSDDQSEPTLVDSQASKEEENRRRLASLSTNGIIVNDPESLSAALETFGDELHGLQPDDQRPNVWDYLVDAGADDTDILGHIPWKKHHRGAEEPAKPQQGYGPSLEDVAVKVEAPGGGSIMSSTMNKNKQPGRIEFDPLPGTAHSSDRSPGPKVRGHLGDVSRNIPFLQWKETGPSGISMNRDSFLQRILDQIDEQISKRSPEHTKLYLRTGNCALQDLTDEGGPLFETLASPIRDVVPAIGSTVENGAKDRVFELRKRDMLELRTSYFSSIRSLVELFLPINFEHAAARRIWGGIKLICEIMNNISVAQDRTVGNTYHTQDYGKDTRLREELPLAHPTVPFENCPICLPGFKSHGDGLVHLETVHFGPNDAREGLEFYLRTPTQIQTEARISNLSQLMEVSFSIVESLLDEAKDIRLGTTISENSDAEKSYPGLKSFLRVFEDIILLVAITAQMVVRLERIGKRSKSKAQQDHNALTKPLKLLRGIHAEARRHFEQVKIDIIKANRTDKRSGGVTLTSIGPEFMIAMISNEGFLGDLKHASGKTVDPCELYKQYTTSLQLQVNQRPQKRLFSDMYALEEELDIMRRVIQWQKNFSTDLVRVLDPISYKTTTKGRISRFILESRYISRTIARLSARDDEFQALQLRTRNLREQLKQSIEVREESHGKAIRVFTFVTIFFLPLSFVTSFFGMNFADIRNTDEEQRFFWIVALPTTAFVLGIAYLYGYKWDIWKESFEQRRMAPSSGSRGVYRQAGPMSLVSSWIPGKIQHRGTFDSDIEIGGVLRRETDTSFFSTRGKRSLFMWPWLMRKETSRSEVAP
ncbi:hypothetical protein F5Y15DRAFT_251880 [Xylariaceae sp. FL0016]|nr:hypothetical protein F5Y15DRAFT_251880 [Xylariaceae sp. FL0016]